MPSRFTKINDNDDVIIALEDLKKGDVVDSITLLEDVKQGQLLLTIWRKVIGLLNMAA